MKRIRKGNDHFILWQISDKGEPVDLIEVKDTIEITCKVGFHEFDVDLYEVLENGILKIEIKTELYNKLGIYNFNLKYKHLDISMSDGDRKREVNYKAFRVVAESENADYTEDIPITSDIAFGFNGLSAYDVWIKDNEGTLDDYFDYLRQPSIDASLIAQELSSHPPKVIADYWHEWDLATKEYKTTGVKAKGDKGDPPILTAEIDSRGHLVVTTNN